MKKKENRSKEEHTCLPVQWCCCSPVVILESLELFFRDVAVKKKEKTTYTHKKKKKHTRAKKQSRALTACFHSALFVLQLSVTSMFPVHSTSASWYFFFFFFCLSAW